MNAVCISSNAHLNALVKGSRTIAVALWQENQQKEVICQREWAGAFPVAANGTYEIEFRDVFGNICTDELITEDFTKDGIDWSLDLTFSEKELTKDPILFTAEMPNNENKDKKNPLSCI